MRQECVDPRRRAAALTAEVARLIEDAETTLELLDRERYGSCSTERELGEDRQVGVQPYPIQPADARR
jgi:hypothetical protein